MTNGDIVLLLILAGSFITGFVWGTARTLLFMAGWVGVFLLAMHVRPPLSGFLQNQWTHQAPLYNDMAAMGILYTVGMVLVGAGVWFGARNIGLWARSPDADRLLAGLLGVVAAVLVVAGAMVTLGLFYGYSGTLGTTGGPEWTAAFYRAMLESQIGTAIHESVLPPLGTLLRPILPVGLLEAFGTT